MAKILPSIFGADLLNLKNEIEFLEKEKTEILHVDMMDGNFVSNIAFGDGQIKQLKENSNMIFDVHMMVQNPQDHIDNLISTGVEMISVHYESTPHIHNILQRIQQAGCKAGLVINPGTPEYVLKYLLDDIDYILIMTINPGTPGQSFIKNSIDKIINVKKMIGNRSIEIQVDGGINDVIASEVAKAGADLIVVGGFLFSNNPHEQYEKLRSAIK